MRAELRRTAVTLAVVSAVAVAGPAAFAAFSDRASTTGMDITSNTLAGPSTLTATGSCNGPLAAKVALSWTATTSTYATGYVVARRNSGTVLFAEIASLTGQVTSGYTDTTVLTDTTYDYEVRAVFQQWTGSSPTASATTPLLCV